jgi:hypothetical protein
MRPLVLFFNELSTPPGDIADDSEKHWSACATSFLKCLSVVSTHRRIIRIEFSDEYLRTQIGDKNILSWFRRWLGVTRYQWLLSKIKRSDVTVDTLTDVYFDAKRGHGLTKAYLIESWAVSFPVPESHWLTDCISATAHRVDGNNYDSFQCSINHLSTDKHADKWKHDLLMWGEEVADNNLIATFDVYNIVMYPLDHEPAHIHLVDSRRISNSKGSRTVAKYRIDKFARLEGPPNWDDGIRAWIKMNQDDLQVLWDLCKKGGHPLRITTPKASL